MNKNKFDDKFTTEFRKWKGVAKENNYVVIKQKDNDSNIVFTDPKVLGGFIEMLKNLKKKMKGNKF